MIFITCYFWLHGGQDEYIALDSSAYYAEESNAMYSSCPPWSQKYHVMNKKNKYQNIKALRVTTVNNHCAAEILRRRDLFNIRDRNNDRSSLWRRDFSDYFQPNRLKIFWKVSPPQWWPAVISNPATFTTGLKIYTESTLPHSQTDQ